MIRVTHNVRQVRERLERFASNLKEVPKQSVAPEYWLPRARREAEAILHVIADRKNRYLIPEFVNTVTVLAFGAPNGAGMLWTMDRIREVAIKLADLTDEQREEIYNKRRQILDRDVVGEWVAAEKTKETFPGGRDEGLSDEQIADRILAILFGPQDGDRHDAAWSLLFGSGKGHQHHLLEFHGGFLEDLLSEEEIRKWMNAVLAVWQDLIRHEVPKLMRAGVRKAWEASAS